MTKTQLPLRNAPRRLAKGVTLAAIGIGAAYGCAFGGPEGVDGAERGAASLEGAGDVSPEGIGPIGTAPTATTVPTTLPPVDFTYDKILSLDPGFNSEGAFDEDKNSPYRVKITNTQGFNGELDVRLDMDDVAPSATTCPQFKLEYTIDGYNASTQTWVPLANRTRIGSYSSSGGGNCGLDSAFEVDDSAYTSLRVFSKGKRTIMVGSNGAIFTKNTSIWVGGTNPVPDPGRKLHVAGIAMLHQAPGRVLSVAVRNDGPLSATNVRTTITGSYKYCPPEQPGESIFCNDSTVPAFDGYFVNPNYNSQYEPWPHRNPKTCSFSSTLTSPSTIYTGPGVQYQWALPLYSNTPGCGPCTDNGRCAHLSVTAKTDSTDETDPWDTWDQATGTVFFTGTLD